MLDLIHGAMLLLPLHLFCSKRKYSMHYIFFMVNFVFFNAIVHVL